MTVFDFNQAFEATAGAHFSALGAETVTLARPRDLRDAQNQQVAQLRLLADAAMGATSITVGPPAGTAKGFLPVGLVLASGVVLSAEVVLENRVSSFAVPVVALAAPLTAGVTWTVPASASWDVADVLAFDDKPAIFSLGQGAAAGDIDRGYQNPKLGFPMTSLAAVGVEPRANDVVTWSLGTAKILGTPKRMGDSVDVTLEVPS